MLAVIIVSLSWFVVKVHVISKAIRVTFSYYKRHGLKEVILVLFCNEMSNTYLLCFQVNRIFEMASYCEHAFKLVSDIMVGE